MKRNPLKHEIEAAKRALEKAVSAHKAAIRDLAPKLPDTGGMIVRITDPVLLAFNDVIYTHPNAAQVAGYVRRVEKLAKLVPAVAAAGAAQLAAVVAAGEKIAELKKQNDEEGAQMVDAAAQDEANPDRKAAREMGFTEATLAFVTAALKPTEEHLKAAYYAANVKNYRAVIASLEAAGWDMEKAFPHPHGSMSRAQYRSADAARKNAQRFTEWDHAKRTLGSNRFGGPEPVKLKRTESEQLAKLMEDAARDAKLALQSYCWKLAGKITSELADGDTVTAATYAGGSNVWGWSFVNVTTAAGSQSWKTKMIVNFSVYGKAFNQWPTTLEWSKGGKSS
jgi:hypothetical protein